MDCYILHWFSLFFILLRGNPPRIIQNCFLIVFAWLCKMWQKDRKIRPPKSAQSLIASASYVKKVVLRRCASFFRNQRAWMCRLSVPWQPPTSGVYKNLATQKRFTFSFFALNVYIIQWPEPLCADIAIFWAVLWPCAIFTLLYFPGLFWIYNSMTGKERKMKGKRKKDERNRNGRGKEGRGKEEEEERKRKRKGKERKRKVWTVPK